jgi:hypothetical protein
MNRHCLEYQTRKCMMEGTVEVTKEVTLEDSCDRDETRSVEVEKEDGDTDEDEDDNNHPQPLHLPAQPLRLPTHPQPPSPPHDISCSKTLTIPPPDIQLPPPLPLAPNIYTHRFPSRLYPVLSMHPPDTVTPLPLPPKPNIQIQPRRPLQTRPPRKHPPPLFI